MRGFSGDSSALGVRYSRTRSMIDTGSLAGSTSLFKASACLMRPYIGSCRLSLHSIRRAIILSQTSAIRHVQRVTVGDELVAARECAGGPQRAARVIDRAHGTRAKTHERTFDGAR